MISLQIIILCKSDQIDPVTSNQKVLLVILKCFEKSINMISMITFVFVTTLLAMSEQHPVQPAANPGTFIAQEDDHKIHHTPAVAPVSPVKTLQAKLPPTEVRKPVGQKTEVSGVQKPVAPAAPIQHSIKVRDVNVNLHDDLLPSPGEQEPSAFGEESALDGRNRRIRVLPAFLG